MDQNPTLVDIIHQLHNGGMTIDELSDVSGMSMKEVRKVIKKNARLSMATRISAKEKLEPLLKGH